MISDNTLEGRCLPCVERIENLIEELEKMNGEYMSACKGVRSEIKAIYKDAKGNNLPIRALRQLVKYRELERKQAALADDLEEQDADDFETLVAALGGFADTPLGQAALDLAGDDGVQRPRFKQTEGEGPAKKGWGKKAAPAATSAEEAAALAEVERDGITTAVGAELH